MKDSKQIIFRDEIEYDTLLKRFSSENYNIIQLDFKKIKSNKEIFEAFNNVLKFPYFGWNWDALDDALSVLEWLENKNCVIFITHANLINKKEFKILFDILINRSNDHLKSGNSFFTLFFMNKIDKDLIKEIESIWNKNKQRILEFELDETINKLYPEEIK